MGRNQWIGIILISGRPAEILQVNLLLLPAGPEDGGSDAGEANLNTIGKILEPSGPSSSNFLKLPYLPGFCPLQSAHRKFHSTETALLKLTNDIMETIDSGKITILTALDMSAAFDTL